MKTRKKRLAIYSIGILFFTLASQLSLMAQTLEGSCSGTATQNEPNISFDVSMQLNGKSGSIEYPTLGCSGSLSFIKTEGSTYWYREHITYGTDKCIDGGIIQIILIGNSISWYWYEGDATASGTLYGDVIPLQDIFEITIERESSTDQCTMGYMSVNGEIFCYTLELPWLDNLNSMSCIPKGTYSGILRYDKPDGWRIQLEDVPDRTGIQIHMGNYTSNTTGCILVGANANVENCTVTGSATAYAKLKEKFYGTPNPISCPNLNILITFK